MSNVFYVYVYLDPRKPGVYTYGEYSFDHEPFYVGKGYGTRDTFHLYESSQKNCGNKLKVHKIQKIVRETGNDPFVVRHKEEMEEKDALDLETKMIQTIGRKDLGKGPLTNLTAGGEGETGYIMSQERKDYLSEINKGENNRFFGRTHTEETKRKISLANTGTVRSEEWKAKVSKSLMGREISRETVEKRKVTRKKNYKKESHHYFGKKRPEFAKKISLLLSGIPKSEEHKKKLGESRRGKRAGVENPNAKKWVIVSPTGEKFDLFGTIWGTIKDFCKDREISYQALYNFSLRKGGVPIMKGKSKGWQLMEDKVD